MASHTGNETLSPEEIEFQQLVCQIGGKERIYLVSDACENDKDEEPGILQEFVSEMFGKPPGDHRASKKTNGQVHPAHANDTANKNNSCETRLQIISPPESDGIPVSANSKDSGRLAKPAEQDKTPQPLNGDVQRTKTSSINNCGVNRTIDSPIIIFIFSQEFVKGGSNEVCLKEILKDVRSRTQRVVVRPALIGLVRAGVESAETRESVGLVERALRSVFRKHAPGSIWVGQFIPQVEEGILAIKRNACRVLRSARAADNTEDLNSWPCLPWPNRRRQRASTNASNDRQQGGTGGVEEGIPLKANILPGGLPDCREAGNILS